MIHTSRFGRPDGVPAVLAHCFLGHSGMLKPLVEAIAPPLDALAFDLPGHGRSPMPSPTSDLQSEIGTFLDGFVAQPSVLIGHSLGGVSMLSFALRNPERVRGLVLIEPVFIAAALADPTTKLVRPEARYSILAREGNFEEAAREFFLMNDPTRDWNAVPEAARATMARQMQLMPSNESISTKDSQNLLEPGLMEGFTPPVLLIRGDRSPAIFPAIIKGLEARFTAPRSVVIEDAGHMVPLNRVGPTADAISQWMQDTVLTPQQG